MNDPNGLCQSRGAITFSTSSDQRARIGSIFSGGDVPGHLRA
jgi:hypothetical protein